MYVEMSPIFLLVKVAYWISFNIAIANELFSIAPSLIIALPTLR